MQFGLPTLLGVLFIVLKLTHVIAWAWVWVLAPFWIGVVLAILVLAVAALIAGAAVTSGVRRIR